MNKKYRLYIQFLVLFIFFAISCTRRIPFMLYSDNRTLLVKRFEQILVMIKNKDRDSLKSMFSKKALDESKLIDEDIDYLFTFFQGEVLSWEQHGVSSDEERNYGKRIKEVRCFFNVDTTDQKYIVFIIEYTEDVGHPENVGLYTLRIIKAEDKGTQSGYWQEMKIPGVYKPEMKTEVSTN